MDFVTLKERILFVLENNNSGTASVAFPDARLGQAVNFAYRQEINHAILEGGRRWFLTYADYTWLGTDTEFSLPENLRQRDLIRIVDITNGSPGQELDIDETGKLAAIFWSNRNTLQWGTDGPGSDKTLRFYFYSQPSELIEDDNEPDLMPTQFHDLLIWSAAVLLLDIADQRAPDSWVRNRDDLRMDYYKFLSRGRPTSESPRVLPIINSDYDDYLI